MPQALIVDVTLQANEAFYKRLTAAVHRRQATFDGLRLLANDCNQPERTLA